MNDDARQRLRKALRHDLRNPLTIILGRCELLESGALGPIGDRQRDSVAAIERNAGRLVAELEQLAALLDEHG